MLRSKFSLVLLLLIAGVFCEESSEEKEQNAPGGKRTPRGALPSVSRDHYSEVLADGTYKFAYTGEHRYVAERRLADGTVEGESLFVRPDGVPVKVHYFADKEGYRPKTEVLYKERIIAARGGPTLVRGVVAPSVREVVVPAPQPAVVLAPPTTGHNSVNVNFGGGGLVRSGGGGGDINVNTNGGDVAAASPSVTAIVGPGGQAIVRPEAVARTSGGSNYFRSAYSRSGSGDVSIANPSTTAIVGPGGSIVVEPKAVATVGGGPEHVREVHHHTQSVVQSPPQVRTVVERVPVPVPVRTPGYVYSSAPASATLIAPPPSHVVVSPPAVAVRSSGVVLVPPRSSYKYSYQYSAPDPKHPQRDNSAYVNVEVNK